MTLSDTVKGAFTMTTNGLDHVYFSPRDTGTWVTIFYFKDPSEIGPGVYTDTIRVGLCTDTSCTALQPNTISTVTVTYTVTGTVPPPPGVSAATTSVAVNATAFTSEQPRVTVPLTYLNERANRSFDVTMSSNYVGALNSELANITRTGSDLIIIFKPAWRLQPGVYEDDVIVNACSKCPAPVDGSPLKIHTTYTITDAVPGPNGYHVRILPYAASELAWDPNSQLLYLAVPATAPANASSLIAIDPQSGAVTGSVDVGMDPTQLSVSADGQYAYVAGPRSSVVRRFKLPGLVPDLSVPLGSGDYGDYTARDIQVSPHDATLVSVERMRPFPDGNLEDLALISNGVLRPNGEASSAGKAFYGVQWSDLTHFYASDRLGARFGEFTVAAGEIASLVDAPSTEVEIPMDGRPHLRGSLLYLDNGRVMNVQTRSLEGVFAAPPPAEAMRFVVPDPASNRLFALVASGTMFHLRSYALDTKQAIAEAPLEGLPLDFLVRPQLIRFGANGLALPTTDGRLLLIEGGFVSP